MQRRSLLQLAGALFLAPLFRTAGVDAASKPTPTLPASPVDLSAELSEEAPIIRIARTIIDQGLKEGASEITVKRAASNVRVLYKIDGVEHEVMKLPKHIAPPLVARYKIMADLNVAERTREQRGRITVSHGGIKYEIATTSVPTEIPRTTPVEMSETIVLRPTPVA